MATRTYGDGCAIAAGLDLIGERWALLVVRELLLGPKRYTDLQRGLPNASPNVLSERLRELERDGVVRRRKLPPPAGSRVYELTAWGRELEGIVVALGHWATRSGSPPRDAPVGVDSVIIALRSRFNSGAAEGLHARYELRLGEDRFQIVVADEGIEVARGDHDQADATIEADPATLAAVLWGEGSLTDARRAGAVVIEGDATVARRFFRLFPVPEPVAVSAD
jgi:DNA-binding HxlR family transcriptional regulator/putative sterol carrier protein